MKRLKFHCICWIWRITTDLPNTENLVFLEVFYFDEKIECDFIARGENDRLSAVQVSLELNKKTEEER